MKGMKKTMVVDIHRDILAVHYDGVRWISPCNGQQHPSPEDAMLQEVTSHFLSCGEDVTDQDVQDEIASYVAEMEDREVVEMAEMLTRHGDWFSGNNANDMAEGWLEGGFNVSDADSWCDVGVWEPDVAVKFRDAGLSPREVSDAAEALQEEFADEVRRAEELDESACGIYMPDRYTDGCPIYSACNGDTDPQEIIDYALAERKR